MSSATSGSISQRILRESALFLIAAAASRAIGFLMIPFYSRFLTPGEYGTIEVVELTTQVVALLIGLGIFGGALLRIYQDYESGDGQRRVASTAILFAIAANLVAIALVFPVAGFVGSIAFKSDAYAALLRATFAAMVFSNIEAVCLIYIRLQRRAVFFVVYSLVTLAATLSLNIVFIAFQHKGVWGFVLSKLVVSGGGCALLLFLCLRNTGLRWERRVAGEMIHFGAPLILANLSFFVLHFGDRFFLSRYKGLAEVGLYSLAYRFAFVISFLVGESFSRSWSVAFYDYLKLPDWRAQFSRASLYLASALAFTALVICLFGDELLYYLVPPSYFGATRALSIVVSAYAIREMGDFFRTLLYVNKRTLLIGAWSVAAAILNTLLNYLWIPSYGMVGASWATFVTWGIFALVMFVAAWKELRISFPILAYGGLSGLALLCYAGASYAGGFFSAPAQFGIDTLFLCAFSALVWRSGILPNDEKTFIRDRSKMLIAIVRRRIWRGNIT